MLSDNIKVYRKKNNLSQEELAEKLGVSRQSISLWETGQTQTTIENIISLTKIFNITSDMLLGNTDDNADESTDESTDGSTAEPNPAPEKERKTWPIVAAIAAATVIVVGIVLAVFLGSSYSDTGRESSTPVPPTTNTQPTSQPAAPFDLFTYCKNFAINIGRVNGDYVIYQQPSTKYGGYPNEYFSISYWADSDMVEFCLHCPLDETLSINFYLRIREGYDHKYEYSTSKYYRDTGDSLRSAYGYIDPAVFYDGYPIGCDEYIGSIEGQDAFMEESREGICDLIRCLKEFVKVEKMECDFSAFEFVNFK